MADPATEEEQIESLRRWWSENGRAVITGVVVGVVALVAWQAWSWYREEQTTAASALYAGMMNNIASGERAAIAEAAETLRSQYAGTTYATLGVMAAARAAVSEDDLEAAAGWLRFALGHADEAQLKPVVRARLARVAAARGNHEKALAVLEAEVPPTFTGLYAAIRGDVLAAQGKTEAAVSAWRQALAAEQPPPTPGLIRRKINRHAAGDKAPLSEATAS